MRYSIAMIGGVMLAVLMAGCGSVSLAEPAAKPEPSAWSEATSLCDSRGIPKSFFARVIYATSSETKGPAIPDVITADEREAIATHFLAIMTKIEQQTVAAAQQKAMYEFLKLAKQREAIEKLNAELQAAEKAANPKASP